MVLNDGSFVQVNSYFPLHPHDHLRMGGKRKHIHRLYPPHLIPALTQGIQIPRQRLGVAGHVHDPLGGQLHKTVQKLSALDLCSLNPLVRNLSLSKEPTGRREEESSEEEKVSSGGGREAGQLLHPAGSHATPHRWTHDFPAAAGRLIPAGVSGMRPPR